MKYLNSKFQLDVGSFDLRFELSFDIQMNYEVFYEPSKFNFGNVSIVHDESETQKGYLGLILKKLCN